MDIVNWIFCAAMQGALKLHPDRRGLLFIGRVGSLDSRASALGPGIQSLYLYDMLLERLDSFTFGGLASLGVLGLREVTFPPFNEDDQRKKETAVPFDIFPARRHLFDLRVIGCQLGTIFGRLISCRADHVELHNNSMQLMAESALEVEAVAELRLSYNVLLGEEWGSLHLTAMSRLTMDSNVFEGNFSDMLRL